MCKKYIKLGKAVSQVPSGFRGDGDRMIAKL
jgi:hypothetical protein